MVADTHYDGSNVSKGLTYQKIQRQSQCFSSGDECQGQSQNLEYSGKDQISIGEEKLKL